MHMKAAMRARCDIGFAHAQVRIKTDDDATQPRRCAALSRTATHCRCRCKMGKHTKASRRKAEEWGRHQCRTSCSRATRRQPPICSQNRAARCHSRMRVTQDDQDAPRAGSCTAGQHRQTGACHQQQGRDAGSHVYCEGGHSSVALAKPTCKMLGYSARLAPTPEALLRPRFCLPPNCHCPCADRYDPPRSTYGQ